MHIICHLFSTVLRVGYLPYAPGTWGSLAGLCASLVGLVYYSFGPIAFLLFSLFIFILGWISSWYVLEEDGYKDTDPSFIVIDEVAGLVFTIGLVGLIFPLTAWMLIGSFLLFRVFDIFKPWPIGWLDEKLAKSRKTAALGIMMDDMVAGLIAALVQIVILNFLQSKSTLIIY